MHPNLQREAAVWLRDTIKARDTPCLVATHSTPFLALPTDADMPLYVYVSREGDEAACEPFDAAELRPLDRIATALGFDRGELLTTVSRSCRGGHPRSRGPRADLRRAARRSDRAYPDGGAV